MAVDAADSLFHDPLFNDDWNVTFDIHNANASAATNFDSSFGLDGGPCGTIDPQLTCSNTSTSAVLGVTTSGFENTSVSELDKLFSPLANSAEAYSSDMSNLINAPYFQSIEHDTPQPVYVMAQTRNEIRRSVSEPPGNVSKAHAWPQNYGLPMQARPTATQPTITFHRERHYLGKPMPPNPVSLKSLPRNKAKERRYHPYHRSTKNEAEAEQYSQQHEQRSDAQQMIGPTSVPREAAVGLPQDVLHASRTGQGRSRYVTTSRICTPTPEPDTGFMVDPALSGSVTPVPRRDQSKAITIPLTVEELRAVIQEAVHQAVRGGGGLIPKVDATTASQALAVDDPADFGLQSMSEDKKDGDTIAACD